MRFVKQFLTTLLILVSFQYIHATDLKVGQLLSPGQFGYVGDPVQIQFEVINDNVQLADNFQVIVSVFDSNSTKVFEEIINESNLDAGLTAIVGTQEPFVPLFPGEFIIDIIIEFSQEIDPSDNQAQFAFGAIEIPGIKLGPGSGIQISQIDFLFPEFEQLNSSTGIFAADFEVINGLTQEEFGFLNLFSPNLGWPVQNMIFDLSSGYPGLSAMFGIGEPEVEIQSLQLCALLSPEPLLEPFTPIEFDEFPVGNTEYNAQGRNMPVGNILAPIPFENIPFDSAGKNDLVWQHGHVNFEQDQNQCGPGALANSLQWLENEQGIKVPHEHKPGIRDNSLVGEIDKASNRNAHQTVSDANMLNGKLKYIDDNKLNGSLTVKHKNRSGQTFVPDSNVTVGNTTSNANTSATSLIDWIISELKDGEDVELAIGWSGGSGHWVDLIGGGYVDGVPWLAWVHDTKQGFDDMGTASTADDTTKANGGLDPASGGIGWSYVINNQLAALFGSDTSRGQIDLALSESKKPSTDLQIGNILIPEPIIPIIDPIFPEVDIVNAGPNPADDFDLQIRIVDPFEQVLFEETIEDQSVPGDSNKTIKTTTEFVPVVIGDLTLQVEIDFPNDSDESNNVLEFPFSVVDIPGIKLGPDDGVQISQIDFTFPEFILENSDVGIIAANFAAIQAAADIGFGYLNVFSPDLGWVIQNMLIDPSSGYPGLSGMINLQLPEPIELAELDLCPLIVEDPLLEPIPLEQLTFEPFPVMQVEYNAQGRNMPVGNILAPIPFENIPFDSTGKNDLVWQHGHVNFEQDQNQCGPGALANSLQWLENEQGINVPHEHKPGIRDTSLVGEIDKAAQRQAHQTVSDVNMLNGKLKYIDDNNLTNSLKVKHKNRSGQTFVPNSNVTVGNTTSTANTSNTSLIDWIISELKDGEDVELAIGWSGGSGHWVDLIGGGYVDGVPWLAWVHDTKQGFDDMGTASTADDTTKANGGLDPKSGGYGWSYVINNQLAALFGSDTSRGQIDLALSESKDTSNVTSVSENELNEIPNEYSLEQNYPNPFNPSTIIRYSVPEAGRVTIKLYDSIGKLVKVLTSGHKDVGVYEINFRADNLSSGVYIYTMEARNFVQSKKLILIK